MSIHATTPTYAGPCIVCGRTNYPLSAGGPTICPRCDCGFTQEQAGRLAHEVEELRAVGRHIATIIERAGNRCEEITQKDLSRIYELALMIDLRAALGEET